MDLSEIIPPVLRGIDIQSHDHIGVITELVQALIDAGRFEAKYKKALIAELIENSDRSIGRGWVVMSTRHPGVLKLSGVYGNVFGCSGFQIRDTAPVTQIALFARDRNAPKISDQGVEALSFFCRNLNPNVHHIFNVTERFWIKGRGLVITSDRSLQHQVRSGEKLIFVRPDETLARGLVVNTEMIAPMPRDSGALCIKNVTMQDVPIDSKVWWINEGTAGAGILVTI